MLAIFALTIVSHEKKIADTFSLKIETKIEECYNVNEHGYSNLPGGSATVPATHYAILGLKFIGKLDSTSSTNFELTQFLMDQLTTIYDLSNLFLIGN